MGITFFDFEGKTICFPSFLIKTQAYTKAQDETLSFHHIKCSPWLANIKVKYVDRYSCTPPNLSHVIIAQKNVFFSGSKIQSSDSYCAD